MKEKGSKVTELSPVEYLGVGGSAALGPGVQGGEGPTTALRHRRMLLQSPCHRSGPGRDVSEVQRYQGPGDNYNPAAARGNYDPPTHPSISSYPIKS